MSSNINNSPEGDTVSDYNLRLIEALIFASEKSVNEKTISEHLNSDADIKDLLKQLRRKYEGSGIELMHNGKEWFFRTAPDLGDALHLEKTVPKRLSRAATETLAIIAYHQPVTRAEIEEIRGVIISKGTIDLLLKEGWIKPRGRRQTPGRPVTWGTTLGFLEHFGLESVSDLPGIEELKASGLLDARENRLNYPQQADSEDTLLPSDDDSH